ncbi:hypothetical protein CUMW_138420 [Citrus unshiu]|uniref:Transposase (putative) gypsy type domain-containing protein n=1 Tax=Citrus unshiu TaxID=55188 RepID=A0A2H5PI02_CITUN|nr:hypothetical protein CUMW_138420 [Citrus unshiu]
MALHFQQETGLVDDVLVDEQDIPASASPATRLLQDIPVRGTLLPDVCSSLLVFVEAYPTNTGPPVFGVGQRSELTIETQQFLLARDRKRLPRVVSHLIADEVMWQKSPPLFEYQTDGYVTLGICAVKCWQPKSLYFIRKPEILSKEKFVIYSISVSVSLVKKLRNKSLYPCLSPTKSFLQRMSKGKEKIVEVDDDKLDFLPSLLTDPAFNPGIPLEPIRSSVGTSARRMSPQITSSSGNSGEQGSSGSENTLSEDGGGDSGEVSPSRTSRPEERSTVGGRALSRDYAIDYMTCTTMFDELDDLRLRYSIPSEILLKVLEKKDTPSRPPRGYSFKNGLRCPLQPYFARILNGLNLSLGQLNPNGWRVLSGLFILWDRCCQSEPTVDEVKHLYQLKSSPKDTDWYYFQSSTKTRKPITDLPTGGGGNWKKKFFFAGGPWGQVAQVDGKIFASHPVLWSQVLGVFTSHSNLTSSNGSRLYWPTSAGVES